MYVAIENIWHHRVNTSRTVIVFAFGLLHGLGFAGVLTELGLPERDFVIGLLSFNGGVELGQLAVILIAYFSVGIWVLRYSWPEGFRSRRPLTRGRKVPSDVEDGGRHSRHRDRTSR